MDCLEHRHSGREHTMGQFGQRHLGKVIMADRLSPRFVSLPDPAQSPYPGSRIESDADYSRPRLEAPAPRNSGNLGAQV